MSFQGVYMCLLFQLGHSNNCVFLLGQSLLQQYSVKMLYNFCTILWLLIESWPIKISYLFCFCTLESLIKCSWCLYRLHDSSFICAYATKTNMNWNTGHLSCMFWHPWWKWAENLAVPYQEVFLLVLMCLKYLVPQMSGLAPAAWEIANYCSVPLIFWFN